MEVSIIIPVYNTDEHKLRRCLDSVSTQNFKDFECLVIDDGSSLPVADICDEYAIADNRFKVTHKANGGVSSARNVGLDAARGTWIVFIDSDDYVESDHLSLLLSKTSDEVDMVLAGFRLIFPNNVIEHHYNNDPYIGAHDVSHFICHTDFLKYQIPWDKMYRRSVINEHSIKFDESLTLSEDRLFCYESLIYISGIAAVSEVTYIHDGTDISTLSYRMPSVEMQTHLYERISVATSKIVERYEIPADELVPLWKSNWDIFEYVIRHTCHVWTNIFKARSKQKYLLTELFDWSLYNLIKSSPAVRQYMQDSDKRLIINGHFFVYDLKVLMHYFKVKMTRR